MKRILALMLSGVMLASTVSAYGYAAETTAATKDTISIATGEVAENSSNTEPTVANLEKAIKAVKQKITIPKEYTVFDYYFSNSSDYTENYWRLTWRTSDYNASINVNCDADYHITYYYHYNDSIKNSGVAKYLKSELTTKALSFISNIAPETRSKLELIASYYEGVYSGNYVYTYQRKENGIAFPDNTVTVSVNSITGEVNSFSSSWLYDGKVPSGKATVTVEEAKKLIKENLKMKLSYQLNYNPIVDKNGTSTYKAYLVYKPSSTYISVDAQTPEVYLSRNQWFDVSNYYYSSMSKETADLAAGTSDGGRISLTEEEIAKIDELKDLISKEKAIKVVTENTYLHVDKNLNSYVADLSKVESSGKSSYVWNISLSDSREITDTEKDSYRAYAYATVDARTGKILSYHASVKSYYDEKNNTWASVKIAYDKTKGKDIFEKFLKSQMNNRFNNTVLSEENDDYVIYYKDKEPVYGGYNYVYNRVYDGIEFPYNYIRGSVDGVTGKIYSFYSNWNDNIKFESSKGAMTADEAMNYYLSDKYFGLKYEVNTITKYDSKTLSNSELYDATKSYEVEKEVRLVYRSDISPAYISPFTGEQLDYNGKAYKEESSHTYADIKDTPENRNILILSDMNVGFEGDNFLPDQAITIGEINKLIQDIGIGYGYDINKDNNAENQITKEELAALFINKLGLEKVSKLNGIYATGFTDEKDIKTEYLGAVALAKGMGIFTADMENKFNPKSTVSRYDAIEYLFKFIEAKQAGGYYY